MNLNLIGWGRSNCLFLIFNICIFRFFVDTEIVESEEYMRDTILGGRQFCLKEPLSTLPKARMQLKAYERFDVFFKSPF